MKTTRYIPIMAAAAGLLLATSCVKNTLYNTPHPDQGKIAVTADWSARGEGIGIPAAWRMSMADYTGSATGAVSSPDYLFAPGCYTLAAWNPTPEITVEGTTASVKAATGNWNGAGDFIHNAPTWFFTHAEQVQIEPDKEYTFTAAMRQQVRELTLVIEPTGDAAERITEIVACLTGAAGTLDFATDTYGAASNVVLPFTKIISGADAGKWTTTVRLLGVTGAEQLLTGEIRYTDDNPSPTTLDSDLTEALAEFNTGKNEPLTLGGSLVETPDKMGFTLEINAWGDGADGDGSMEMNCTYDAGTNTYTVYNEEGLRIWADAARKDLATNCILARNITMEAVEEGASNWMPVGYYDNESWDYIGYTGTFDGGGHTITGLTIYLPDQDNVGLFGVVGESGTVQNLTLAGVKITGNDHVGGVAGYNIYGTVTACYATGDVSGNSSVGGVAGSNYGTVTGYYATGDVSGKFSVGGVAGYNYYGPLTSCYWSNNLDTGVGRNYGGNVEVTKVDGTAVTWPQAADAMNTAIDTWNADHSDKWCDWKFRVNPGPDPNPAKVPLILEPRN